MVPIHEQLFIMVRYYFSDDSIFNDNIIKVRLEIYVEYSRHYDIYLRKRKVKTSFT